MAPVIEQEPVRTFPDRIDVAQARDLIARGGLLERLHQHRLIVVTGSEPSDEFLADLARGLGEPQPAYPSRARVAGHPYIKHQVAGAAGNYNAEYWHQDRNFGTTPATATILQCHEAPGRGGDTAFVDAVATFAGFENATQARLRTWRGVYEFETTSQTQEELRYSDSSDLQELEGFVDPVITEHPATGLESIAIAERYVRLDLAEGVSGEPPSLQLLLDLIESGTVYRHRWQRGDVLLWDNFAILHRGGSLPDGETKVTHRIVVT